jgi:hypothetical protein
MKRTITLMALALFFGITIQAQDDHSFQWRYMSADSFVMQNHDAVPTREGGYVLAGLVNDDTGHYPYLFRVDCKGEVVWAKVFQEITESPGNPGSRVVALSDTTFMLVSNVGFFFANPLFDIFLAKVNWEGEVRWTRKIGGGSNKQDLARSAIRTQDGHVVIAGQTSSHGSDAPTSNSYTDQYFLKVDEFGNILWTRTIGNPQAVDRSYNIVELPDKSLAAAGSYIHTGGTFYANLVKMDKDGTILWHKAFGEGTVPHATHSYGFNAMEDGGFLLTGSTTIMKDNFTSWGDIYAIRTDAAGDTLWTRVLAGGANDSFENGSGAAELPNGNLIIMGATNSYPTIGFVGNKYVLHNLDADGEFLNTSFYNQGSSHYPNLKKDDFEGSYLITGFTNWTEYGGNGNRFDPLLINLDETLGVNDCFFGDVTNLTSVFRPGFDADDAPGTIGSGGEVMTAQGAIDFPIQLSNLCEVNGYTECEFVVANAKVEPINLDIELFPNPAFHGEEVSLNWESELVVEEIIITDLQGSLIQRIKPGKHAEGCRFQLDAPGFYFVRGNTNKGNFTEKIIIH